MNSNTLAYWCKTLATVGPLGYYKAPGTLGSLVGLMLMYCVSSIVQTYILTSLFVLLCAVGVTYYIIKQASTISIGHDPQEIILDEVIGCCVALFGISIGIAWNRWAAVVCFGLFRFFDISKCLGGAYIEKKYAGPAGILGDDIYAGLLAALLTRIIIYYSKL
jgi:phosphatidylglycerophosphatase A